MSRRKLICVRWMEILLLGGLHCLVFGVVLSTEWGSQLAHQVGKWSPFARFGLLTLVSTGFFTIAFGLGALGAGHFDRWRYFRYPPIWFAPVFGIVFVVTARQVFSADAALSWQVLDEVAWSTVPVVIGFALGFLFDKLRDVWEGGSTSDAVTANPVEAASSEGERGSEVNLLDWMMTEEPISHPSEDFFGHRVIAERIAGRLLSSDSVSVGLTGPYGSGKSSVISMVRHYLELPGSLGIAPASDRQLVCCHLRGWGRDGDSIARQALNIIVHELKKYVDMSSLIGLPASYQRALGAANSLAGSVATLLTRASPEPSDQLRRLDNILAVSNLRLVLFLEDLDRDLDDNILGVEVPGLLDRMRKLRYVSFVIALATERYASQSILRICDYTESLS